MIVDLSFAFPSRMSLKDGNRSEYEGVYVLFYDEERKRKEKSRISNARKSDMVEILR
jgi:hypothetical protein